jgi:hypothetical protein
VLSLGKHKLIEIGQVFGRLTVIEELPERTKKRTRKYFCYCICGNSIGVCGGQLNSGNTKSCGCLVKERMVALSIANRKAPGHLSWTALYGAYKLNAKYKKNLFSITFEQFKEICSRDCYYCGISPSYYNYYLKADGSRRHRAKSNDTTTELATIYANGIDRADNDKGYVLENCIPCCKTCNYMKTDMSKEDFEKWLDRVAEHRKSTEIKRIKLRK